MMHAYHLMEHIKTIDGRPELELIVHGLIGIRHGAVYYGVHEQGIVQGHVKTVMSALPIFKMWCAQISWIIANANDRTRFFNDRHECKFNIWESVWENPQEMGIEATKVETST
jgi:hypothetical protein